MSQKWSNVENLEMPKKCTLVMSGFKSCKNLARWFKTCKILARILQDINQGQKINLGTSVLGNIFEASFCKKREITELWTIENNRLFPFLRRCLVAAFHLVPPKALHLIIPNDILRNCRCSFVLIVEHKGKRSIY